MDIGRPGAGGLLPAHPGEGQQVDDVTEVSHRLGEVVDGPQGGLDQPALRGRRPTPVGVQVRGDVLADDDAASFGHRPHRLDGGCDALAAALG